MITNAILSFLTTVSAGLLPALFMIDVAVDLVTSIPVVTKFILYVVYIIPWQNLVPLLVIVFALLGFRIVMALLRFILALLPG